MHAQTSTPTEAPAKPAAPSLAPPGTVVLCVLTIGTAIAQSIWDGGRLARAVGVVPENLLSFSALTSIGDGQLIPTWLTLFIYVFPHGGWWHVLPNMMALWVFGAIAERVMGTGRFVLGYFVSGAVGAFCKTLVPPHSPEPIAGASLAIGGIVGAYAAMRWLSRPRTGGQRLLVFVLETASILGVVAWLAFRIVPATADRLCSAMYHFIPFLAMWLAVRVFGGGKRIIQKIYDRAA